MHHLHVSIYNEPLSHIFDGSLGYLGSIPSLGSTPTSGVPSNRVVALKNKVRRLGLEIFTGEMGHHF